MANLSHFYGGIRALAMYLNWLHLLNFKNWEEKELQLEPGLTCLVGPNGRGKTNLLDAIYYLCFTKSFLNTSDTQAIRLNESFFMLEGKFQRNAHDEHIQVSVKRGQKKLVRRNKKEYEKLSDHIGLFPAVMVSPQTGIIITGSSEERRRWIDILLSQLSEQYLQNLINYQRVLHQRNSLIKQMAESGRWDEVTLEIYDQQLELYGTSVFTARNNFVNELKDVIGKYYQFITNGAEEVEVKLQSQLSSGEPLASQLAKSRGRDRSVQYTTVGVHKDDLDMNIQGMNIKKFASQGQQKSFLMALKLAEYHFLSQHLNMKPILMLDDIFDKLDEHRIKKLLVKVSGEEFGQVLITDTGSSKLRELFTELGIQAGFYDI